MTEYEKVKPKDMGPEDDIQEEKEKKKLTPVVSEKPKKYKKGLLERLVVGMIGPDGVRAVGHKISTDIIVPAIKNIVVDSITSGINMAIFGPDEGRHAPGKRNYGGNARQHWNSPPANTARYQPKTNYGRAYGSAAPAQTPVRAPQRSDEPFITDHLIEDRTEALNVLNGLREQILDYGEASVADYYDLIGLEATYTDNDYGWRDLSTARLQPVRGGYIVQFPPVEVL